MLIKNEYEVHKLHKFQDMFSTALMEKSVQMRPLYRGVNMAKKIVLILFYFLFWIMHCIDDVFVGCINITCTGHFLQRHNPFFLQNYFLIVCVCKQFLNEYLREFL